MDKLLPLKTDPLQKNCCKKLRYFANLLQNKRYLQIAAKERYLKFASNFSHSHNCVTPSFV
jgi:hypothetical protein